MNRASSFSESPKGSSWAGDLVHPLPLAAVVVLGVNDHLLKGAGVLPGWATGKLSDFAGLFFFPILLVALLRGASKLITGRDITDKTPLAALTGLVTCLGFSAVKLYPPFNAWIADVWGVMQMDATDLFALPVIPLSVAFLLRSASSQTSDTPNTASRALSPARRWIDFAAVSAAALTSFATSSPRPPVPPSPPPPVAVADPVVAVASPTGPCGNVALNICERSPNGTFVVAKAMGVGPGSCALEIVEALEIAQGDGLVQVEMLPSRFDLKESDRVTFSLSFLRPVDRARLTEDVALRLQIRSTRPDGESQTTSVDLSQPCTQR